MVFDIQTILIIALLLLNLIIGALLLRTELRLRKLFRGKESQSLEDLIQTIHKDTEDLRTFQKESISSANKKIGLIILDEQQDMTLLYHRLVKKFIRDSPRNFKICKTSLAEIRSI